MEWWWLAYLALGVFVGFFAGLLGIGGGLMIVTALVLMFGAQHFPTDRLVHLAYGTSLTSIVFTNLSSVRAHHQHDAILWKLVARATPGIVVGTLLGSLFADQLPSRYLAIFFTCFVFYSGLQMWMDLKPRPSRQLPGDVGITSAGLFVGALSSLVGAGGGVLTIPLMLACNVPMRKAIGTSAALGLPIALAGAIGYIATGLGKDHLPALTVGYVYLPALVGLVLGTSITVPAGARAAHRIPVIRLKRIFAIILFLLASKMLMSLLAASH